MFAGVPAALPLNVTLCVSVENCHVTVPPAVMSTCAGTKCSPVFAWTVAVAPAGATVTPVDPAMPLIVAVIVAVPTLITETNPVPFTVATDGLDVVQAALSPVTTLPLASVADAANCIVPPSATADDGSVIDTVVTGPAGVTVGPPPQPHAGMNSMIAIALSART